MFVGPTLGGDPTSPVPDHDPGPDRRLDGPSPAPPPQPPPCWAAQAQSDLAQAEAELRRLHGRHATELDAVKRSVERAILGARSEERRLLERVEQDHRDAQQRLEQVQRDNVAAVRVSQSLLDQRFQKLAHLQQQITAEGHQSGPRGSGPNQNLMKEVAEFLQPWEISVSLKKVNFKPSSQPNAIAFGDIRVQEQSMNLCVGGCGPQGRLCVLHSLEVQREDADRQSAGGERGPSAGQRWTSPTGRVFRKINLSTQGNLESEEQTLSSTKISHWLPKCEQADWESSQDDEMESASLLSRGEDASPTAPTRLKDADAEGTGQTYKMSGNGKHYSPRNQRKSLTVASGRKPSPSPERRRGKASPDSGKRPLRHGSNAIAHPGMTSRELPTSRSCVDLTSRDQTHSCLSQSSDEHSLGTHGDSGRAPSPADSLDSSYTFIVSPGRDRASRGSLSHKCHLSRSAVDLTHKTEPLVGDGTDEHAGPWGPRVGRFNPTSNSASAPPTPIGGRNLSYPACRGQDILHQPQRRNAIAGSKQTLGVRSFSMSVIDGSSRDPKRDRGERAEPPLLESEEEEEEEEEEGDRTLTAFDPRGARLVGRFGKQGSGRADLTLPSGIHATPQGLLFVVDCGNARVQVTDPQGNVLQQVTSPNPDGSGRKCRNYFDLAVNTKGLIALSCAAERALLVFSRHGRLLQTFGGSGFGAARDELEAPRGVTVTRLDEFLVADIRRGTLTALKLDAKSGSRLERTVVTGFHRPYLVAACLGSGMVAVSERGNETGCVPCVKVLEPGWSTVRVLGVCAGMGPVLRCPWGVCIDPDGNVLVADWGEQHRVLLYPARGAGWPIVTQGLSSPRGLTLLPGGQLAVSDSMHHCVKIYRYKVVQD